MTLRSLRLAEPFLAACVTLTMLLLARPAHADPEAACRGLRQTDFSTTRDAPFLVNSATLEPQGGAAADCRVTGFTAPEITFELRLPVTGWNHGFMLVGSGGWATRKRTGLCREPLRRGYACIAGDAGHQTNGGLWMQSNPQAKIDWGYRAMHAVALVGKTLARSFYGDAPKTSLMLGCSTGGYQALVETQRFPWDFDGVIAIAPDIDEGDLSMRTAWAARNLVDAEGRSLFAKADLELLHRAALAACDGLDGVKDGLISDPLACRFDPRVVRCGGDAAAGCLSERQVAAALRIYAGPTDSAGDPLSTAGPFPGSELGWPDILQDVSFAQDFFRFALAESPRDGFPAAKFDFDEDYKRLGLGGTFVSSDPDLRRFGRAGGKLMIIQGTNDVTEQAHAAIDYYDMVDRVMGGGAATRAVARLFLVPGMNHCSGGEGAFAIDYLSAMERWVGDHHAPDVLVGAHAPDWTNGDTAIEAGFTPPPPGMTVTFTRPVYPYPLYARYDGRGDVDKAASFRPASPK